MSRDSVLVPDLCGRVPEVWIANTVVFPRGAFAVINSFACHVLPVEALGCRKDLARLSGSVLA
jgi:hypothetical protein